MKKLRIRRMAAKLRTPSLRKIAAELQQPGEFGRAVPGNEQAAIEKGIAPGVTEEKPAIPAATGRVDMSTYFTKPTGRSEVLYRAESWVRIRLMLETAGPVSVGSRDNVTPVLSGAGILLPINVEITFPMTQGNRIFIAATAINRVRVIIEPIPWEEQKATMLGQLVAQGRK